MSYYHEAEVTNARGDRHHAPAATSRPDHRLRSSADPRGDRHPCEPEPLTPQERCDPRSRGGRPPPAGGCPSRRRGRNCDPRSPGGRPPPPRRRRRSGRSCGCDPRSLRRATATRLSGSIVAALVKLRSSVAPVDDLHASSRTSSAGRPRLRSSVPEDDRLSRRPHQPRARTGVAILDRPGGRPPPLPEQGKESACRVCFRFRSGREVPRDRHEVRWDESGRYTKVTTQPRFRLDHTRKNGRSPQERLRPRGGCLSGRQRTAAGSRTATPRDERLKYLSCISSSCDGGSGTNDERAGLRPRHRH